MSDTINKQLNFLKNNGALRSIRYKTGDEPNTLGYFHQWVDMPGGVGAIIERPDGTVIIAKLRDVQFPKPPEA